MGDATVFVEPHGDGHAIAVVKNQRIIELIVDSTKPSEKSLIGSVFSVKIGAFLSGINGTFVTLPNGAAGFLRGRKVNRNKPCTVVSVKVQPEGDKAQPVSAGFALKGRYTILTPFKPGINFSRTIRDEEVKKYLRSELSGDLKKIPDKLGLIFRSMAEKANSEQISEDISKQMKIYDLILNDPLMTPNVFVPPLKSRDVAFRDWINPDEKNFFEEESCFDRFGGWEKVHEFLLPQFKLSNGGTVIIEKTSALIAVDINSGADISRSTCLKTNLLAMSELPAQLQVRGLGGKIIIDFAPLSHKDRYRVSEELLKCCKRDKVEIKIFGWTKSGCLEVQKKRDKPALSNILGDHKFL
ncbi:MAG: ribonuclease E/G [Pseudomonadota bacterium]|nr:ribonuclease E/G [Pseudomonadota bacterium]